jgi:hypothetical protein
VTLIRRLLSPLGFALVGLCFLLPFVVAGTGDDGGRVALEWRGGLLAVGGTPTQHTELLLWDQRRRAYVMQDVSDEVGEQRLPPWSRVPAQPAVMAAVVLVVAGVLAGVPATAAARAAMAGAAGSGAAGALAVGQWLAFRRIAPDAKAVDWVATIGYGWWLAIGLAVALALANAVAWYFLRAGRRAAA